MELNKDHQYVYRIGSDNQHRLFWDGRQWRYEFLAGGVLFDEQPCPEDEVEEVIAVHGLTLDKFRVDDSNSAAVYSQETQKKINELMEKGIDPCPKHGLMAKNLDNTCEACSNTDYPDDFKGTEG